MQVIFAGKTTRCLPKADIRGPYENVQKWHITFSATVCQRVKISAFILSDSLFFLQHWSDETSMRQYVDRILVPYFVDERKRLQLPSDQWCIAILDCWSIHKMSWLVDLLKANRIAPVFVPGGTTGDNQPQDLSVNRPFKAQARDQFETWLASLTDAELARAGSLPALKANVLSWINAGIEHVRAHADKMLLAGWRHAGILPRCFDSTFQKQARFVVVVAADASAVPKPCEYVTEANLQRLRALDIPISELVVAVGDDGKPAVRALPRVPAVLPPLPATPVSVDEDETEEGACVLSVLRQCCRCVNDMVSSTGDVFVGASAMHRADGDEDEHAGAAIHEDDDADDDEVAAAVSALS